MLLNLTVVSLFAVSWVLRTGWGTAWLGAQSKIPQVLAIVAAILLLVSGWLGGHLVYVHGVGVDTRGNERV